ncbi:MAG: hypothetical protein F6K50_11080 [Moorea sp. SIO3I7]|nr:hypothetical protein [Moorena sp. SIO3I8]NEN96050.1 hypothetical protein [Moorena sp. SIO3I7]NEO06297.1 hypothetical protein [Moorena sp. SIO3I8]
MTLAKRPRYANGHATRSHLAEFPIFPTPYSLLPTPCSLFPVPCSLLPLP